MSNVKISRVILFRCVLAVLILLNLYMIFGFSKENATQSSETSKKVSEVVADITVPDFEKKTEEEKAQTINRIDPTVREMAHMTEFGTLGALSFLFLLTWNLKLPQWAQALIAVGFCAVCAAIDELHQLFSPGRAWQLSDIAADTGGAAICCAVVLLILYLIRLIRKKKAERA